MRHRTHDQSPQNGVVRGRTVNVRGRTISVPGRMVNVRRLPFGGRTPTASQMITWNRMGRVTPTPSALYTMSGS